MYVWINLWFGVDNWIVCWVTLSDSNYKGVWYWHTDPFTQASVFYIIWIPYVYTAII
jgi:hypothetical protein